MSTIWSEFKGCRSKSRVSGHRHLFYEERLPRLDLQSFRRQVWTELITILNIFTGPLDVDSSSHWHRLKKPPLQGATGPQSLPEERIVFFQRISLKRGINFLLLLPLQIFSRKGLIKFEHRLLPIYPYETSFE